MSCGIGRTQAAPTWVATLPMRITLLGQLDRPVRFADELGPTRDTYRRRGVQRLPVRTNRRLAQTHRSLVGRAIGLPLVARHASQHTVGPTRDATLSARHDVVDRQFFAARLHAAILALEVVTLKNVAPTERHCRGRQAIVIGERNHLGHPRPSRSS